SVQESMQKSNECAEINTRGTAIVLEEAARARAKKLIFSSSAAIYGDNPAIPTIESMPAEPKSPYATSKYEGERHCCSFTDEGRLATVSLRYFNVFGPYQDPRNEYTAAVPALGRFAIWRKDCAQRSNFSRKTKRPLSRAVTYDPTSKPLGQRDYHRAGNHPAFAHSLAVTVQ